MVGRFTFPVFAQISPFAVRAMTRDRSVAAPSATMALYARNAFRVRMERELSLIVPMFRKMPFRSRVRICDSFKIGKCVVGYEMEMTVMTMTMTTVLAMMITTMMAMRPKLSKTYWKTGWIRRNDLWKIGKEPGRIYCPSSEKISCVMPCMITRCLPKELHLQLEAMAILWKFPVTAPMPYK